MTKKIIEIGERKGPGKIVLQRVMDVVPKQDRDNKNLQRLIAFRLEIDGEKTMIQYIKDKIEEAKACDHRGSLYDFLKDEIEEKNKPSPDDNPNPPIVA